MVLLGFISTGWLIFIVALVLVALFNFVIFPMLSRKNFSKIAAELGLSYDPEAKALGSLGCEQLPALRVRKVRRNLLHGTVAGVETVFVEVGERVRK